MISLLFIAFSIVVFASIYLTGKIVKNEDKQKGITNWIILIASVCFVIFADYRFALCLGFMILTTWLSAKYERTSIGIIVAIGMLVFFKYTNFFMESFSRIIGKDYVAINILLPLGISFYTFSAIGYLVDVKRGNQCPQKLLNVALFMAFYPKLTSGPIQTSSDFFQQLEKKRQVGWNSFSQGIQIFAIGLFKKLVLADYLNVFVNQVYSTPKAFSSLTVLMAAIGYSLQIYFDFSGYSDLAIGSAKIIGFDLPRNFNLPYMSHNVTEFWKRWHITLSSWLQRYLYISMGGSRKGKKRTYINLLLTMVIGGIWHGANWTYVVWGALHGLALIIHKVWMNLTYSNEKEHSTLANICSIVLTFFFTTFCWIFFRAESIGKAFEIIDCIIGFRSGILQPYSWLMFDIIVFGVCAAFAIFSSKGKKGRKKNESGVIAFYPTVDLTKFWGLVVFFVFCGLILCLAYTGGSPFIYGKY